MVPRHIADRKLSQNVLLGFEWAAVTIVMISGSTLGMSTFRSIERCIGTILGGFLAFGLFSASSNGYFLSALLGTGGLGVSLRFLSYAPVCKPLAQPLYEQRLRDVQRSRLVPAALRMLAAPCLQVGWFVGYSTGK